LSEVILAFQNVAQSGTQRRNTRSHRNKNQIPMFLFFKWKAMTDDAHELDRVARFQLVDHAAGATPLFDEHFEIRIFRCTRKRKVPRMLPGDLKHRDLSRHKLDPFASLRAQAERTRQPRLIANPGNDKRNVSRRHSLVGV
jgi:hypothetical protein